MSGWFRNLERRTLISYGLFVAGFGLMVAAIVVIVVTSSSPQKTEIPTDTKVSVLPGPSITVPATPSPSTTGVTVPPLSSRVGIVVPPKPIPDGVRLIIPSIGVNATVVSLGLNADGTLQVPASFDQAGWWSGGTFPGQPGPAVVVGHVSSVAGPAVFYRLGLLHPGDLVTVTNGSGTSATFSVTRLMEVNKDNFPTQLVYGPVSDPELRLVTCSGSFNSSTGHFVDNTIVFAKLTSMTS